MEYSKISDNIYIMHPTQGINPQKSAINTVPTTCIANPDGLIFVDCGVYPNLSSKFRLDMETKFQRKTTHLLLTHLHWDHFLAMESFKDVDIIASESGINEFNNFINIIDTLEEDKWASLLLINEEEIISIVKKVKLFPPNTLIKEELIIGSPGNEVIFRIIGGHSIDSAYIYIPSEKVLCAGDNLIECYAQLPGTPEKTIEIYTHWASLAIDKIIPGHGNVVDKNYLLKVKTYFEDLVSALKNLIKNKIPRKEIFSHHTLPIYFAKNLPNWTEGSKPNMKWIEMTIKGWYRYLKHKKSNYTSMRY
ncbi:MAG: MBL fold metallo-hydrolase [Candidatus Thorarchaeota archaeon]